MNRLPAIIVVMMLGVLPAGAQEDAGGSPVQSAPKIEDFKNLLIKICSAKYYNRDTLRCDTREFYEQRGDDLVFLVQRGARGEKKEMLVTGNLSTKLSSASTVFKPHSYFLQFPLKVGGEWKGTYDQTNSRGQTRTRTRTATVVGYGDLKLKAGIFKAYEIQVWNQWSEATRPADEKYYYCPEISAVCSYESKEFDSYYEVVSVSKKKE